MKNKNIQKAHKNRTIWRVKVPLPDIKTYYKAYIKECDTSARPTNRTGYKIKKDVPIYVKTEHKIIVAFQVTEQKVLIFI